MCKAGIAGILHFTLCSLLPFTGPDALHHGRYGPDVLGYGRSHARCVQRHMPMVQTALKCGVSAVCSFFSLFVVIPVAAQMQILMVFTTEFPQLQYIDKVVDVCCAGCCIFLVCNNIFLSR